MGKPYIVPVSVKGIVFEGNEVWLRKNERGEWELPGGKIDKSEQPEEALKRELMEELGFEVEITNILQAYIYTIHDSPDESHGVLVLIYLCKLIEKIGEFELEGEAGLSEYKRFSLKEVKKNFIPKFYKKAILKGAIIPVD